jgi:hypothetical protein
MTTLYVRNGTDFREATTEEILSHSAVTKLESNTISPTTHIRHLLVGTHGDLRIKGRWFELAGFAIGAQVRLRVFKKRLVIDVVKEPPETRPRYYRGRAAAAPLL